MINAIRLHKNVYNYHRSTYPHIILEALKINKIVIG
jgi:hypothetical protein